MPIVLLVLAILVVVGIALAAAGHGEAMSDDAPDRDGARLPERPMHRGDVDGLRFSLGLRGYRMDEVDDVLDRLAEEIERRDLRIADLESRVSHRAPAAEGDEHRGVEPGDRRVAPGERPGGEPGAEPLGVVPSEHPTVGADRDADLEHRHDDAQDDKDARDGQDAQDGQDGKDADEEPGGDATHRADGAHHDGGAHRGEASGSTDSRGSTDGSDRADGNGRAAHNGLQADGGHRAYGSGAHRVEAEDRA